MDKSYRVKANVLGDTLLHVNMNQDFDFLEILSLKLSQKDAYKRFSSNYGVVIGRVLANDAFGIPNAKVSVFIEKDSALGNEIENLYPFEKVKSEDSEMRRYNLLPDYSDDGCYRVVGTFPNKRFLLDNDIEILVYDKYYRMTTVTNQAGDYMLFGVPTGNQDIHVDMDLSDIGVLSQKPRDYIYKGYDETKFDSSTQFKHSTNLTNNELPQIFNDDKNVFVYPFWGDTSEGISCITRLDFKIDYKFETTCVFMGSIISDNDTNAIGHRCEPHENNGMNSQLISGKGTIEMIRKTTDGIVESYQINGNQLIDENGVWCYQIPMNLDYVGTDEYGNIVPTDDPSKGVPTRAQVRFRISKDDSGDEGFSRHTAKYLVPMNPMFDETSEEPHLDMSGVELNKMYNFGSNTPQNCFRDLYWNNVYSVKNYIPKIQVAHRAYSANYSALKGANSANDKNEIPFNKLKVDVPFLYLIVCMIFTIVITVIQFVNIMIVALNVILKILNGAFAIIPSWLFGKKISLGYIGCIPVGGGLGDGKTAYYPGCTGPGLDAGACPDEIGPDCEHRGGDKGDLKDLIQQNLAESFNIVKLDFYQDWLNGSLYMPLWYWRKRKKKTFLFPFIVLSGAKNEFCDCDKNYSRMKIFHTCGIKYKNANFDLDEKNVDGGEKKWHKKVTSRRPFRGGVIKRVENRDGLNVYYYAAIQSTERREMETLKNGFGAVRLYATDIILLGNLNENNIYGVPQLFKVLPSTTANVPPIATIKEVTEDEKENNTDNENNDVAESALEGMTSITGMDVGHNGSKDTPKYQAGLFMDLACMYANTMSKSCFNVERLSELGVSLDMTYTKSYSNSGNGIQEGVMQNDGFVTKIELDDLEYRAMFATMNHIGFIPQTYQESVGSYTTQVEDENTNYLIPKFQYMYPTDFDGRQQIMMNKYKNGFEQAMYDEKDETYISFRLGGRDINSINGKNRDKKERIRHFYITDHNKYEMPLYNNSFYFYFGVNKGKTAIEKFNSMFVAECTQNEKIPFTLDVVSTPNSYCPQNYKDKCEGIGHITVTLDDINKPYSYRLRDGNKNEVVSEVGMTANTFTIGLNPECECDKITDDKLSECRSVVYQLTGEAVDNEYGSHGLSNQTYTLIVQDSNMKQVKELITLKAPNLSFGYDTQRLGTKFYTTDITDMTYICDKENDFYGRIRINGLSLDGYPVDIKRFDKVDDTGTLIMVTVSSENMNESNLYLKIESMEGNVGDCLCNSAEVGPLTTMTEIDRFDDVKKSEYKYTKDSEEFYSFIEINVYQPKTYVVTLMQECDGMIVSENQVSELVRIFNGENFHAYLNTMPVLFMLGSNSDTYECSITNNSMFYKNTAVKTTNDKNIKGWFGVHQEDSYMFQHANNLTVLKNQDVWSDFVTIRDSIKSAATKREILQNKFNYMFKLSDAVYQTSDSSSFELTSTGGVSPTMFRSVIPIYSTEPGKTVQYIFEENNIATVNEDMPNIVGNNYSGHTSEKGAVFNKHYKKNVDLIGNYFAAFTRNGGYVTRKTIDKEATVMRIPGFASVSPNGKKKTLKEIGESVSGAVTSFSEVYDKNPSQTLSGDKQRKTNPYLRALTVDRRLDYDLTIIAPSIDTAFDLYNTTDTENKNKPWKTGRIFGSVYNGIDMSYDDNRNIIYAKVTMDDDGNVIKAENDESRKLEYSYEYSETDTDAKTIFNKILANGVFENELILSDGFSVDGNGYILNEDMNYVDKDGNPLTTINADGYYCDLLGNVLEKDKNGVYGSITGKVRDIEGMVVKRFYKASLGLFDIRDYFWSNFSRSALKKRLDKQGKGYSVMCKVYSGADEYMNRMPYIYSFPYDKQELYNGDFNRDDVLARNYPIKRYIDVGNIAASDEYGFNLSSCSYRSNVKINQNGTITCEVEEGEAVDMKLGFDTPIEFITPDTATSEFGNIVYGIVKGNFNFKGQSYRRFSGSTAYLSFQYNTMTVDGFDSYAVTPKVISVLPMVTNGSASIDGLSYIKTATDTGEIMAAKTIDKAIDTVRIADIRKYQRTPGFNPNKPVYIEDKDYTTENGLVDNIGKKYTNDYFFYNKNAKTFVKTSSSEMSKFIFMSLIDIAKSKVFTILVKKIHLAQDSGMLNRKVVTYETSELFDARDVYLRAVNGYQDSGVMKGSYVSVKTLGTNGSGSVDVPVVELDPPQTSQQTQEVPMTGETALLSQTVVFDLYISREEEPAKMTCQAFMDFSQMGFTFSFVRYLTAMGRDYEVGPTYTVNCSKTEVVDGYDPDDDYADGTEPKYTVLRLNMSLPQEMGILQPEGEAGQWKVRMYATTRSGFIYKLNAFGITASNPNGIPDTDNKDDKPTNITIV